MVIGAGVIGLELGSVWQRLGARVTVVEYLDRILPGLDSEVAKTFQKLLERQGFTFKLGRKVTAVEGGKVSSSRRQVVNPRRKPPTSCWWQSAAGPLHRRTGPRRDRREARWQGARRDRWPLRDQRSRHLCHRRRRRRADAGPQNEDEGIAVAELLAGKAGHVNYDVIPAVVYTSPEVAAVGRTEEDLKAAGVPYKVGKFSFLANGRAKSILKTDGFVKILAHADTDRVLGVHIIGPGAGEAIAEAAVLMEFSGSSEDLARTCHAHPTLSEAMKEAALAVDKRAIHA